MSVVSHSADMWCHGLDTSGTGTKPTSPRAFSASYSFWVRSESPGWRHAASRPLSSLNVLLHPWCLKPGTPKPFLVALGKSGQAPGSGSQAMAHGHPQVTTSPEHQHPAAEGVPPQISPGQDTEAEPRRSTQRLLASGSAVQPALSLFPSWTQGGKDLLMGSSGWKASSFTDPAWPGSLYNILLDVVSHT